MMGPFDFYALRCQRNVFTGTCDDDPDLDPIFFDEFFLPFFSTFFEYERVYVPSFACTFMFKRIGTSKK